MDGACPAGIFMCLQDYLEALVLKVRLPNFMRHYAVLVLRDSYALAQSSVIAYTKRLTECLGILIILPRKGRDIHDLAVFVNICCLH